jgi:hypothetical protein
LRAGQLIAASAITALALSGCSGQPAASRIAPTCRNGDVLILVAQAVPSATQIPCITEFPVGWSFGGEHIQSGQARFWMDSDRAGTRAVTVTLTPSCDTSGTMRIPVEPDEAGTARFEEPQALPPHFSGNRYYTFPGGCVTYRFAFRPGIGFTEALEATSALTFFSRAKGVKLLRKEDLELCGAGVSCPG